ncbi:hypothetical protein [Chromobacterium haemolyticum]|uniref:hypothetical protein n=1 Tax=Chromobacterium haemolyticum TaxID=394935 RepID=UPI00307F8066
MDAVRHTLPDPRQYHPQVALTNMLIHNAQSALNAKTESDREMWFSAVRDAMAEMLARGELLSISVALAMVPSQQCYQLVWDALRDAVENTGGGRAIVFAMPLVLVAGSKSQTTLPGEIADEAGLNQLLREHGVFAGDADVALGGALLHPDSVVGLDSAQLYKLNRDPVHARALLPQQPAPVTVKEEGVFLRYLLGVAIQPEGAEPPLRLGGAVGSWGMPLMKFLGEQLKADGVTLFPIARPPMPAMQAMVAGNYARFEVAMQVFASSQIRRLRELNKEPVAILSAHDNGELHITLSAEGDERNWEAFVWPLAALDNVQLIEESFRELMAECHVREVHVLPELHPDTKDGVPLFFTADDL